MGIMHQTDTSEQLPDRLRHGQKVPTTERLLARLLHCSKAATRTAR